ncbi:unnamed protein product [Cylindrotheca closterium]|uniref:V-SNARE coiled-coil homology domain-containing protein n=1 Tax=Cylindrotheca closterium TaxID=2856 RepID=A0AAD2PTY9_9STRA|nr:unnamed protein product [Cylindrotheca closterium]CAJ1951794.1 unnamed protein product [Cylindrotheca closterium]
MEAGTPQAGILWSCIARNDIIVAEAHGIHDERVQHISQELMRKKPTPGWEFYNNKSFSARLKGLKFHIYEHVEDSEFEDATEFRIWVVGAVYDPAFIETQQAKSFIEKIVGISQVFREHDMNWQRGSQYCAQPSFGPILDQRMQEVSYLGKVAMVEQEIQSLKQIMAENIDMILDRGDKIDRLQEESKQLNEMTAVFKKNSKKLKKKMMWQNAKYGMVVGTAVTVGVAAVTIPIVAL